MENERNVKRKSQAVGGNSCFRACGFFLLQALLFAGMVTFLFTFNIPNVKMESEY